MVVCATASYESVLRGGGAIVECGRSDSGIDEAVWITGLEFQEVWRWIL